jgi:hypothetical protein
MAEQKRKKDVFKLVLSREQGVAFEQMLGDLNRELDSKFSCEIDYKVWDGDGENQTVFMEFEVGSTDRGPTIW